jgi:hypothetical protein
MSPRESKQLKKPRNKWTHIFALVMKYLLRDYNVEIIPEFQLYKEPMRIDILIIKLLDDFVIKNTVMRFFRKHNVVEFKGPGDNLSIEAFDRVLSYFYAYLSQNSLDFNKVAITFVSVKSPNKLFEILENKRNYKIIHAKASGIYYFKAKSKSSISVPAMQLVVNSQLSAHDADWIKVIRNDWTVTDGVEIVRKFEDTNEDKLLSEVIYSLCSANSDILEEVNKMTEERKVKKFLESWAIKSGTIEKWKREGRQEGRQNMQQMFDFLSSGHTLEEAKKKFSFS